MGDVSVYGSVATGTAQSSTKPRRLTRERTRYQVRSPTGIRKSEVLVPSPSFRTDYFTEQFEPPTSTVQIAA